MWKEIEKRLKGNEENEESEENEENEENEGNEETKARPKKQTEKETKNMHWRLTCPYPFSFLTQS